MAELLHPFGVRRGWSIALDHSGSAPVPQIEPALFSQCAIGLGNGVEVNAKVNRHPAN